MNFVTLVRPTFSSARLISGWNIISIAINPLLRITERINSIVFTSRTEHVIYIISINTIPLANWPARVSLIIFISLYIIKEISAISIISINVIV